MQEKQWYYATGGQRTGPLPEEELRRLAQSGSLPPDSLVWTEGLPEWITPDDVAEFRAAPPSHPAHDTYPPPGPTPDDYVPIEYAGFWKRAGALLIDSIILMMLGFVLGALMAILHGVGGRVAAPPSEFKMNMIGVVLGWLYAALFESSSRQATLGKMALGIMVTDRQGRRISFLRATARHFGKIISTLSLFIGYLMAAFTERKQALHDMLAGCLVVRSQTTP